MIQKSLMKIKQYGKAASKIFSRPRKKIKLNPILESVGLGMSEVCSNLNLVRILKINKFLHKSKIWRCHN